MRSRSRCAGARPCSPTWRSRRRAARAARCCSTCCGRIGSRSRPRRACGRCCSSCATARRQRRASSTRRARASRWVQALSNAMCGSSRGSRARNGLDGVEHMLRLYRGPLLDGPPIGSEPFAQWMAIQRSRLEGRLESAVLDATAHDLDAGRARAGGAGAPAAHRAVADVRAGRAAVDEHRGGGRSPARCAAAV